MQRVPIIGEQFVKEIPPSDNVGLISCLELEKQPLDPGGARPLSDTPAWFSMLLRP
jgi:hypothetical protein